MACALGAEGVACHGCLAGRMDSEGGFGGVEPGVGILSVEGRCVRKSR